MTYADYNIDVPQGRQSGEVATLCPNCSHTRKKKTQKCLSVNLDKKVWRCNHCEWAGGLLPDKIQTTFERPKWKNNTQLSDKVLKWFESRFISASTVNKLKITEGVTFMPQESKEVNAIEFNYFLNGELINIKYRDAKKNFKLHKNAQLILYNIDSIKDANEVWITEGEIDCLSLIESGIESVVSVPNGAGNNLQYLDNFMYLFDKVERVHICVDNDLKGRELKEALSLRFGKHKTDYIEFEGCKDANEYLISNGAIKLKQAAKVFIDFPMEGVFTITDIQSDIFDLYFNGLSEGFRTGMPEFDKCIRVEPGYLTTVTGIPGHGKSDFVDHWIMKLMVNHGWRGAYYSPENRPVQLHVSKLIRKLSQRPFTGQYKLNQEQLVECMTALNDNVWFVKPETDFSLKSILAHVAQLVNRKGIKWFVIDAWNKLEHKYTDSETKYIGESLDMIVNFCERYNVHCFLVAHPKKITKTDGKHEIPTLYDIAGSANFFNKTDNGITVYRNMMDNSVEVHVQKVKFSNWGEVGCVKFSYDVATGLYKEL
jgi:twinkle protein